MSRSLLFGWCLLLLTGMGLGQPAPEAVPGTPLAELSAWGVEPNRQGVRAFLESLRWTPAREARTRALLADLSNDRFRVREKATAELLALPPAPRALLEEAAGKDLETRRRVETILDDARYTNHEAKVLAVLHAVAAEPIRGLAPLLLELMPQWPDYYVTRAAARAAEASAGPGD